MNIKLISASRVSRISSKLLCFQDCYSSSPLPMMQRSRLIAFPFPKLAEKRRKQNLSFNSNGNHLMFSTYRNL